MARLDGLRGKTFPFYLVIDVSASMWHPDHYPGGSATPFEVIQDTYPGNMHTLQSSQRVAQVGAMALVTFGTDADVVTPLTYLDAPDLRLGTIEQSGETNYRAVFELLAETMRHDLKTLRAQTQGFYAPVVFFITDGLPFVDGRTQSTSEWDPAFRALVEQPDGVDPIVVALGMGDADEDIIRHLARTTIPGVACIAEPGTVPTTLIAALLESVAVSITQSTAAGGLVFETPAGMRRLSL
jgi:uncharacterized protein YegL